MKFYGIEHYNRGDHGCCPGHDKIYRPWGTRSCELTRLLKRLPKKKARRKAREDLRQYY